MRVVCQVHNRQLAAFAEKGGCVTIRVTFLGPPGRCGPFKRLECDDSRPATYRPETDRLGATCPGRRARSTGSRGPEGGATLPPSSSAALLCFWPSSTSWL